MNSIRAAWAVNGMQSRNRTVESLLLALGVALSIPAFANAALTQQQRPVAPPPIAPPPAATQLTMAKALDRLQATSLQMRDVPWQGHPLAVLIEWATAHKPKPARLPPRPDAPGTLRFATIMLPRSPGRPLAATSPAATGRPAVALARDLIRGSALDRVEVADAMALAAHASYARTIRCDGGNADQLAAELPRFTSLRGLHLGTLLSDQVASALVGAIDLRELTAGCSGLTDAGVFALGQLPSLRKLVVFGDASMIRGQTLPTLRQLQCLRIASPLKPRLGSSANHQQENHRQLVHAMVRLPDLQELQFVLERMPQTTREARELVVQPLTCLPNLRRLGLVLIHGKLSPYIEQIASRPLTHLHLGCESLTAANAAHLARNASLRELDLSGVHFDDVDAAVASLAKMTGLQRLGVAHVNLTFAHRQLLLAALPGCLIETAFRDPNGEWCLLGETAKRHDPRRR